MPRALPEPIREAQVVERKVLHDGECRSVLLKEIKDQVHSGLHLFIRVQDDPADGIIHQANGQTKAQFSLFGFRQFSSVQALPEPVQFGLAHRALKAQQQSIIVVARIIDAVFVNDERVGEGTNLQEVIPIAARARQA